MKNITDFIKVGNRTPLEHQERLKTKFVEKTKPGGGVLAFHTTGTGKTYSSIYAAHSTGKDVVAVVPASLRENYKKELKASGLNVPAEVISYEEALKRRKNPEFLEGLKDKVVVYDEGQRMGSATSQASSLPRKLKSHKNLVLSATPIRNHPTELVPLLAALTDDPTVTSVKAFRENYIQDEQVNPRLLARLRGVKAGTKEAPKNVEQLAKILKDVVDVQGADDQKAFMPNTSEEHVQVPMSREQYATYKAMEAKNPSFAYRMKYGLPPDKKDFAKYKAFLTGLRQVSNTSEGFQGKETSNPGPKLVRAAEEISRHAATVPNYKGYSYSNYLGSGVEPLQKALEARGIKTAIYSGKLDDKEKKKIVEDYNNGKIQHILVSSSGAEGLDLKGTKLVQVLEPHWNNAKIHQVKARGVRYKSHDHLPEEERHVHVQHFFSHPPQSAFERWAKTKPGRSADHAVHDHAQRKDKLNKAFLDILKSTGKS